MSQPKQETKKKENALDYLKRIGHPPTPLVQVAPGEWR